MLKAKKFGKSGERKVGVGHSIVFTKDMSVGEIFEHFPRDSREAVEIRHIMRKHGLEAIGYGIDHGVSLKECAGEQCVEEEMLAKIINSLNRWKSNLRG